MRSDVEARPRRCRVVEQNRAEDILGCRNPLSGASTRARNVELELELLSGGVKVDKACCSNLCAHCHDSSHCSALSRNPRLKIGAQSIRNHGACSRNPAGRVLIHVPDKTERNKPTQTVALLGEASLAHALVTVSVSNGLVVAAALACTADRAAPDAHCGTRARIVAGEVAVWGYNA